MSWRRVVGLALLVAGASGTLHAQDKEPAKKPVPLYTNEDLERISPHRDETGVSSRPETPAPVAAPAPRGRRGSEQGPAHAEAYWRREAEHMHDRLQRARDRIQDLRARIAAREAQTSSHSRRTASSADTQTDTWRRQLSAMEERVRETESRFEDRARREGALPGWLR